MQNDETVNVRYMVDDVDEAIAFYTKLLGFELLTSASPAFAISPTARRRCRARCSRRSRRHCPSSS